MANRSNPVLIILFLLLAGAAGAQDTLPKFTVTNAGSNRYIIGWVNIYPSVKQIGIQRSFDSLVNYKTILTVADPNAKQNGFADTKAPNDHMFYRLFVVMGNGQYYYTTPRRPVIDTTTAVITKPKPIIIDKPKDSAGTITKPVIPKKPEFIPSFYVYTNKDGYVFINLPDADKKKYRIRFYENEDDLLFEIKLVKETALTLDKANFMRSGWFHFELFDDEKLVEKNKFYLAREF